ncbi:MAG: PAS domain-containing protein [Cyanobacteria bacterium P01_G01_bin.49]
MINLFHFFAQQILVSQSFNWNDWYRQQSFYWIVIGILINVFAIFLGARIASQYIRDLKQAKEALQTSEEQFRQLVDNIQEVFWITDISTVEPMTHQIHYLSPAYKKVWGRNPEELYENPLQWLEAIHPDDRKGVKKELCQKACTENVEYEYRIIRPDGTIRWIRDRGFPLKKQSGQFRRLVGLAEDITQQKQTEEEIRRLNKALESQNHQLEEQVAQSTAELEMLFNMLPDFVFVLENPQMRISFCNQVFAKGIGLGDRANVEGKTIFDCFPAEDANYFAQQNQQVFDTGETLHVEETLTLPDGERHFDTYKVSLKNSQGEVYALLGTSRDITELIQTKRILMERTRQLEATNQELDSFCYSVSHDLRAPVRHISGFVNALRKQLSKSDVLTDPKVSHYLDVIENSGQKMGALIDGLLTLSRVDRRELIFRCVQLNPLVATAINLVSSTDDNPEQIKFEIGDLPTVQGDPALLQQVFVNLLNNAIKFSRGRGQILIQIGVLEDGTLFVSDNGVGFDMKYAEQIFEVFQRLHSKAVFEGTGIGLSIVQRIIHRHGGRIWVESAVDQGTTFYFNLQ